METHTTEVEWKTIQKTIKDTGTTWTLIDSHKDPPAIIISPTPKTEENDQMDGTGTFTINHLEKENKYQAKQ